MPLARNRVTVRGSRDGSTIQGEFMNRGDACARYAELSAAAHRDGRGDADEKGMSGGGAGRRGATRGTRETADAGGASLR